jgi:hypothetical protein
MDEHALDPALKRLRFQFGLRTLSLAMTFASVASGGVLALLNRGLAFDVEWSFTVWILIVTSPAWIPFAFLSFAIGRRQLTARTVFVFSAVEIASIAIMLWANPTTGGRPWPWPW